MDKNSYLMYGIYVKSTRATPYAQAIIQGYKTLETRTRDVFKSLFKNKDEICVAIIETSGKRSAILGLCILHKGQKIDCETFRSDEYFHKHLVPPHSKYDVKDSGFKWCYECTEPLPFLRPAELPRDIISHGRSYCEFALDDLR